MLIMHDRPARLTAVKHVGRGFLTGFIQLYQI